MKNSLTTNKSAHFSTIIIGAGPAGLMAGIATGQSQSKQSTLIIEKGTHPGRKLLITAAGQCNLTHMGSTGELLSHYNKKERFLRPALFDLTNSQLIDFFESKGVPIFLDEKGRYLPKSLNAHDILHALINECKKSDIQFHFGDSVKSIISKESCFFTVKTGEKTFTSERVIIATGGKSFPKTGSNGDGYQLAESLGHSIIPPRPALTGITVKNFSLVSLSGVSFENITIDIYRENKKIKTLSGDFLITHKGVSGPVIINNTRYIIEGDLLKINFVEISREELALSIKHVAQSEGKKSIGNYLRSYNLPKKFIPLICSSPETPLSQLKKEERDKIITKLTESPILVDHIQGFNTAMVTSGGINTKEINPKTMESRLIKGLFFAGEVIDIDGDSGGYNLQAAFSTGNLAGK